ncbi:MAG: hypothetical protein AAGE52_28550 [Myxococcota bacterium]
MSISIAPGVPIFRPDRVVLEVLATVMPEKFVTQLVQGALLWADLDTMPDSYDTLDRFVSSSLRRQLSDHLGTVVAHELVRSLRARLGLSTRGSVPKALPPIVVMLASTDANRHAEMEEGLGRLVRTVDSVITIERALTSLRRPVVVFDGHAPTISRTHLLHSGVLRNVPLVVWGVPEFERATWERGSEEVPLSVLPEPTTWRHLLAFLRTAEAACPDL